ncbi:MAG: metal-dependent hydrolase [Sphingobacteriaceae bacterium]|nr:metal-dependent hydrolase [Sphingobacteriaceae bacterium]
MDSVSHIVIGAAIGETFLGKKIGRWGMLLGAVAKSAPDFDLFYTGLADPRAYMCEHRAHTHSLFIEALYAIPIAWLLVKLFKQKVSFQRMLLFMLACLWGHSLLDWCTNFGTQLLLPFSNENYSLNTLAIVDLLFTLPMLAMVLTAVFHKRNNERRNKLARASLIYCLAYLGLTFINKAQVETVVQRSMAKNNIPVTTHITNPTMLNNVLWYSVASNDSTVFIGEVSLFHRKNPITWYSYPRNQQLMQQCKSKKDVEILRWFGDPYTIAETNGDTLNMYAVKFGRTNMKESALQKTFVFHYKLYQKSGIEIMGMMEPNGKNTNLKESFVDLWERIWGRRY